MERALLLVAIAGLLAAIALSGNQKVDIKQQAIDRGFAEYNTTNGQWQWKENK